MNERYAAFVERLKRHDDRVANIERQLLALPPSRLREHLALTQTAVITALCDSENPTIPIPGGTFDGPVGIALARHAGRPIGVALTDINTHTALLGTTGSGKTSGAAYITANIAAHDPRVKISYFDPKADYRRRAIADPRCIIITPDIPLNILRPPSFMTREAYHALLFDAFGRSHWAGHQQIGIVKEATQNAYARTPDPNLGDVVECLRPMMTRDNTYTRRDKAGEVHHKLTEFQRLMPGVYNAKGRCLTMDELTSAPVYWPMVPGDTYEFLFTLWLLTLYHRNEAGHIRDTLDSVVVIDESLRVFSQEMAHMEGSPLLDRAVATMREMCIGLVFTTSSWRRLSTLVRSNINIQIAMLTTDGVEADEVRRSLQLTPQEFEAYQRFRPLECLVRIPAHWPYPVLATVPAFPAAEKLVNEREWLRAAQERQENLLPPAPPPVASTTTAAPQPTTTPSTERPVLPVQPVDLSDAQHALLKAVDDLMISMSTTAYSAAKLNVQSGDRAAKHLEAIGLLTRTPITARPGRGGSAIALQLTAAGYKRLGTKPRQGLRGGSSPQHTYIVTSLAKCIRGAVVESTLGGVGGKSCDIVFRVTQEHDRVMRAVASNAQYLSIDRAVPAPEELVAIEVETSADTASNNALKNLDAGIALNITAVMPKALDGAKRALMRDVPTARHPRLVIIDALRLLDSLRDKEER